MSLQAADQCENCRATGLPMLQHQQQPASPPEQRRRIHERHGSVQGARMLLESGGVDPVIPPDLRNAPGPAPAPMFPERRDNEPEVPALPPDSGRLTVEIDCDRHGSTCWPLPDATKPCEPKPPSKAVQEGMLPLAGASGWTQRGHCCAWCESAVERDCMRTALY